MLYNIRQIFYVLSIFVESVEYLFEQFTHMDTSNG